jgi:hypothetical protein
MDFSALLKKADAWRAFLVEVRPCAEIEGLVWTQDLTYTNLWWTVLGGSSIPDGVPSKMTENGVEYLEAYSLTEANSTAGSFYFDYDNKTLYVHTKNTDSPGLQTTAPAYDYMILAYFWRYFTNAQYTDYPIVFSRQIQALVDGEFEQWTSSTVLAQWTSTLAGTSTVNRDSSEAHGGAYCVRLDIDGSNSLAKVSRAFRAVPGALCTLMLYYWMSTGAGAKIRIKDSGDNVFLDSSGNWQASDTEIDLTEQTIATLYTLSFNANSGYTDYVIELYNGSAAGLSIYFDDASLLINREQNTYLPYITTSGTPELQQSVSPFHESSLVMEFGTIQFANDGWWYDQLQNYTWAFKEIVIRFGARGSNFADFAEVFRGVVRYPKTTDILVSLEVTDNKIYTYKSIPNTVYDATTYPHLEDGADDQPIPIIYGEFAEIVPTCIDTTTYKFKLACHALEAIVEVYKNGVLQTENTDYTPDLANGEFTMANNPGEAFIVCHVKGRKCAIADGTYSENVADILYDLLVTWGDNDPQDIDLKSFLTLQGGRSQKHHIYLNTVTKVVEVARLLQASALFHLVPLLNGKLGAFRYYEGTDSDTPVVDGSEIRDFGIENDTDALYKSVKVEYGYVPSEGTYSSTQKSSNKAEWKHDAKETLSITSSLRIKADAEELADYYIGVLQEPLKKVTGIMPSTIFSSYPGSKVIITKTRLLPDGSSYSVLSSAPYRFLSLKKSLRSGATTIVAWDDLQSSGSGFCEVCYHCQTCVEAQTGTCTSCYSCQACNSGQCASCQTCYYCQACNSGQCASCQSCYACQSCNTCETTQCAVCVACEKCVSGETSCDSCQLCNSCERCFTCEKCYGGLH